MVAIICPSSSDTRLSSTSASVIAVRSSQDVSAQLMPFCTIYINYNHKLLVRASKLATPWDKFKGLAWKRGFKFSQEEKKEENEILLYICFAIGRLVLILIINSEICL